MRSWKFPQMFKGNHADIWKSNEYLAATKQNTEILIHCEKGELFCDPGFGLKLKAYLFDQNSFKLKDAIIDTIYTQIALFIPQVKIKRDDIDIIQDRERGKLYANFTGINQIDYQVNTYQLVLFDQSEEQ